MISTEKGDGSDLSNFDYLLKTDYNRWHNGKERVRRNMRNAVSGNVLKIVLEGKLDSANAASAEEEMTRIISKNMDKHELLLDAKELTYLSSAGLRIFLKIRKRTNMEISIINVSDTVFDILSVAGFEDMFEISRKMRTLTLSSRDILNRSINGVIYRLQDDNMVKVFNKGVRIKDIKKERDAGHAAMVCGVPTAIPFDVVMVGDCYGIVYEAVGAVTLAQAIQKNPEKTEIYAKSFAEFLKEAHSVRISSGQFPDIKERYRGWLRAAEGWISREEKKNMLDLIENTPDGDCFVHGNINPGSVVIHDGEMFFMDMAGSSYGNCLFDLQGLYSSLVVMEKVTHMYCSSRFKISGDLCRKLWDSFFPVYLGSDDAKEIHKMEFLLSKYCVLNQRLLSVLEG